MQQTESRGRNFGQYLPLGLLIIISILGLIGAANIGIVQFAVSGNADLPRSGNEALCAVQDAFSAIADQVAPGVVSITAVQQTGPTSSGSKTGRRDDLRDDSYGVQRLDDDLLMPAFPFMQPDRLVRASGSGAIVRRSGDSYYALTNYHVVQGAYRVSVRLYDGTELKGVVAGLDPYTDLAVVRISSPRLSDRNILKMGDSDKVKPGSWAIAVGSPYGFEHSLTVGVISALDRELEDETSQYIGLIQTDAAINKGNSGGPLLDVDGNIIGINTAIASPTGTSIGLGFAVPVNAARDVLDLLIQNGRVVRGWMGIGIQELSPVLREYYKVQRGVLVASVAEKGPAAAAGITDEDIITRIDQTDITGVRQLQRLVASRAPGDSVMLRVVRSGQTRSVRAEIGLSPSTPQGRPQPPPPSSDSGIRVRTLTESMARGIGLQSTTGVIVVDVRTGSVAEDAGLEGGDVVIRLNGEPVTDDAQFSRMLKNLPESAVVVLKVVRKGMTRIIGFRME